MRYFVNSTRKNVSKNDLAKDISSIRMIKQKELHIMIQLNEKKVKRERVFLKDFNVLNSGKSRYPKIYWFFDFGFSINSTKVIYTGRIYTGKFTKA